MIGGSLDAARMIQAGARGLGVELSEAQSRSLAEFLGLLRVWNARFRLLGTQDRRLQINKHIVDSLVPSTVLQGARSLVDVGTGAGFPGIPLSVSCPHLLVTLVDSRRTRANFMREAVRQLGLSNVKVVERRIEGLTNDPTTRGSFDATIARAWAQLPRFLEVSAGLLRRGGVAVSMQGPKTSDDLRGEDARFSRGERKDYCLPDGSGRRTLVVFARN